MSQRTVSRNDWRNFGKRPYRGLRVSQAGIPIRSDNDLPSRNLPGAPFATTKVEGSDNVYVFRYQNHQAMFVLTSAGVIATDPAGGSAPAPIWSSSSLS